MRKKVTDEQREGIVSKISITLEQAEDTLSHIVEQKIRWGKNYKASEVGMSRLLDCLILMAYSENGEAAELRKTLAGSNRAKGAAEAREAKQKAVIEDLRRELKVTQLALKKATEN